MRSLLRCCRYLAGQFPRHFESVVSPPAGALLLDQAGLHQAPQFAAGGQGIDLVEPLVLVVSDLVVVSQVNQGQALPGPQGAAWQTGLTK